MVEISGKPRGAPWRDETEASSGPDLQGPHAPGRTERREERLQKAAAETRGEADGRGVGRYGERCGGRHGNREASAQMDKGER